ncbi:MAG: hypothetical protein KAS78_05630 [Candidatus Pacebacteria bacterium]|nr:hypothetical protein [Candidatus Paceibacterota bacterium]
MKIEEYYNTNQKSNNEDMRRELTKSEKYRKRTMELRRDHAKTIDKLIQIAQDAGFEKLYIKPFYCSGNIEVDSEISRQAVLFSEDGLENHEILAKIDNKFALNGARLMMLHEKQHFEGPADKMFNDYIEEAIESQTNLQMINKNSKDFQDLISAIAMDSVYTDIIYNGMECLKGGEQYVFYEKNYNFLNSNIIDKILKKESEIRKALLRKYNKFLENQKK